MLDANAGSDPLTAERTTDSPHELAAPATSPVSEPSLDGPVLPAPSLDGVADVAERERVFAALFNVPGAPQRLGRYVVLGTLGRGGMGTVLEAFDRTLDRRVAIKVLHGDLAKLHRARLLREAQALAKLSHPNVVQVYEVGEADGQVFIAMELVRGQSLWDWAQQDPRPSWQECVRVYVQAGEGLAAAHAEGLVHRDFKPSNAVIDDKGRVRVLDFGLARARPEVTTGDYGDDDAASSPEHLAVRITQAGALVGTPAYMAPEQLAFEDLTAATDQFAFCVTLWEALYGKRPFRGRTTQELAANVLAGRRRSPAGNRRVPSWLRRTCERGLAVEPSDRWPSMDALLEQLRRRLAPRRRLVLTVGGGVTLGLGLMGVGLAYQADMGQRCSGARAQLDGVWDDERRQRARAALVGTGVPYAPDTWERVEQRLDDYAGAWTDAHTEACEATAVRQEQSEEAMELRMGCLRTRKLALDAAVGVLTVADAEVVANAVELVADLPGLARCDDVDLLQQSRLRMPPPEDPQVAQEVEQLRSQLAALEAKQKAGKVDDALVAVQPVVERAEALGYGPLLAEALVRRGRLRAETAQYVEAERDLERALELAVEHGHDRMAASAVTELTRVVGYQRAHHQRGLGLGTAALAMAKAPDADPLAEADASTGIGLVLMEQGKLEEARSRFERALTIREAALGPDHPAVASSLNNIGNVLTDQGQLEAAQSRHERALAIREAALGPDHPDVASSLNNVGNVLMDQRKLEAARSRYERALAIGEKVLGPDHPEVATSLSNIASVLMVQEHLEEARSRYERALTIREKALGPDHTDVAISLSNIGLVLTVQGKLDAALSRHERALSILEGALGPDHANVAAQLGNIGTVLMDQGKLEEARSRYERAVAILEGSVGPDHRWVATFTNDIGIVLMKQGELEAARSRHERALAIYEDALGPRHSDVAYALIGLANVALGQRDFDAARMHAERAVSIREAGTVGPTELAEARFVLARALGLGRSERARARTLAEQARDGYREQGADQQAALAEVEQWLETHPLR